MKVFRWHFSQFLEIFDRGFTLCCHCVVESEVELLFFFSEEQMPSFMFLKDYRHQGWVTGPQSARGRKKKESKAGSVPVGFWWYVWLQICSGISSTKAHSLLMQLLHYQLILCRWALCQNIVFRPLDLILVLNFGESTQKQQTMASWPLAKQIVMLANVSTPG